MASPNANFERLTQTLTNSVPTRGVWQDLGIPQRGAKLFKGLQAGFSYTTVEGLVSFGWVTRKELSEATGIALSTLDRRKAEGSLSMQESDKVYSLVRLLDATIDLFSGDSGKAGQWLRKQARGLGGRAPLDMIRTTAETESVMDFIGRVKHGVVV